MKMKIIQGLFLSFLVAGMASAAEKSALKYEARTEIGSRTVLSFPYVSIGENNIVIDAESQNGVCIAYGLGAMTGVELTSGKYSRLATFDDDGTFKAIISAYGEGIFSITCKSN